VFNAADALAHCCGKPEILREMIQCFFDEMNNLFPQMRAALRSGDLVQLGRLGHRMKGTVVYLGTEPTRAAALRVERLDNPDGGTRAEAEQALDALQRECLALKAALAGHPLGTDPRPDAPG
jgi:HPt (histidine-containing phosphotransfer) domain-containing protein